MIELGIMHSQTKVCVGVQSCGDALVRNGPVWVHGPCRVRERPIALTTQAENP